MEICQPVFQNIKLRGRHEARQSSETQLTGSSGNTGTGVEVVKETHSRLATITSSNVGFRT